MKETFSNSAVPNILVVDDTPANLELLSGLLRAQGYAPRPVPSGKLALAAARAEAPDLVLLDIRMPEMDGFEVCERLKADETLRDVPVIFITAAQDREDKVRAFSLGAVDYVTKPFQVEEVQARVRTHLHLRSLQRDLKEHQEAILETALDGFMVASREGRLLEVNATFCRMTGYSQKELLTLRIADLEAADAAEVAATHLERIVVHGEDRFETRLRRKDGDSMDIEVSAQYRHSGSGRFVIFVRDISGRKRSDELLRRNLGEKETLLKELFHRTRNNMQVIMSILAFEEDRSQDPLVSAVVKKTSSRIMSMSLAHKMLYDAQDLSSIDLGDYLREVVGILVSERSFPGGRIEVTTRTQPVSVLIDVAVPCGLVIHELVSNALLHAFPGERRGEVRVEVGRAEGGEIELEVSDDGVGLPELFDFRKEGKLGSQLILGLVEQQIKGSLSIRNVKGLTCHISFDDSQFVRRV